MPSPSTYRQRFGGLRYAYEIIGYGRSEQYAPLDVRRRTQYLREELIAKIVALFPDVSVVRRGGRWRSRLRIGKAFLVSVLMARTVRVWKETIRWQIDPVRHERRFMTLVARLDASNHSVQSLHILPNIDRARRFSIQDDDPWLKRGVKLIDLSGFRRTVDEIRLKIELRRKTEWDQRT